MHSGQHFKGDKVLHSTLIWPKLPKCKDSLKKGAKRKKEIPGLNEMNEKKELVKDASKKRLHYAIFPLRDVRIHMDVKLLVPKISHLTFVVLRL